MRYIIIAITLFYTLTILPILGFENGRKEMSRIMQERQQEQIWSNSTHIMQIDFFMLGWIKP